MGDIPGEVAGIGCPVDELRFAERRDYVIDCNWKVYIVSIMTWRATTCQQPSMACIRLCVMGGRRFIRTT